MCAAVQERATFSRMCEDAFTAGVRSFRRRRRQVAQHVFELISQSSVLRVHDALYELTDPFNRRALMRRRQILSI